MASSQPPGSGSGAFQTWNNGQGGAPPMQSTQQEGSTSLPKSKPILTEEERKVLKDCERESFYYRALPFSAGCIVGVQILAKQGKVSLHPKYGIVPKSILAAFLGYFMGKISYLGVCRHKIVTELPNSRLAAEVRKSMGVKSPESSSEDSMSSYSAQSGLDEPAPSKADQSVPTRDGLDDRFRPSVDRELKVKEEAEEKKAGTTYDELRRRNRQEYIDKSKKPPPPGDKESYEKNKEFMPQSPWPDSRSEQPPPPPPAEKPKRKRTNMWGDVIED